MYWQDDNTGLIKTSQRRSLYYHMRQDVCLQDGAHSDATFGTLANKRRRIKLFVLECFNVAPRAATKMHHQHCTEQPEPLATLSGPTTPCQTVTNEFLMRFRVMIDPSIRSGQLSTNNPLLSSAESFHQITIWATACKRDVSHNTEAEAF